MGNLFLPSFCRHTWRGVSVPPQFFWFLGSAITIFFCVCSFLRENLNHACANLHHAHIYVIVQKMHSNGNLRQNNAEVQKLALYAGPSKWRPQLYSVTQWSKRDQISPLNFLGPSLLQNTWGAWVYVNSFMYEASKQARQQAVFQNDRNHIRQKLMEKKAGVLT